MALNPFLKKQQPTTGYDGSGITAGTPYAPGLKRPMALDGTVAPVSGVGMQADPTIGVGMNYSTAGGAPSGGGYDGSGINPAAGRPFSLDSAQPGMVYPASSNVGSNGYAQPSNQNPQFPITAPNYMGPGPVITPQTPQPNWADLKTPVAGGSPQINFQGGATQVSGGAGPQINYNPATGTGVTGNYTAAQIAWNRGAGYTNPGDHNASVQASIDAISDKGGAYLTNATRRGLETAGQRGLLNSSIAAGAANRSAIEAMEPYVGQAVDLGKTREGFAFQSGENALDRSLTVAVENGKLSQSMAELLATHTFQGNQAQFDRTLQTALAQGQIDSQTYQLLKTQQFNSSENALDRGLQQAVAQGQIDSTMMQQLRQLSFTGDQNAYDRALQSALQQGQIDASTAEQLRNIGFQSMQSALDRTQQQMLQNQQYAYQGEQNALDRSQQEKLQSDAAFQKDWLDSRSFSREFQTQLSMIPLSAAADLTSYISKYAVENPEIYTPEIINGMSTFMAQNMASILAQYFPNQTSYTSSTQTGGTP